MEVQSQGGGSSKLKCILNSVAKMDKFQVVGELHRFALGDVPDDILHMKLVLKKVLIEEILKEETANRDEFKTKLREITISLAEKSESRYVCCLSGCRFRYDRHREYVKHIKVTHPNLKNIVCNFNHKCVRILSNLEDLVMHIKADHHAPVLSSELTVNRSFSLPRVISVDEFVKCNMVSCGSKQFSSSC